MADILKNPITGIIDSATSGIKKVAEVFKPNAEQSAQRDTDEQMALMKAYQAEFNTRNNRNWVDSLADAINRLVRPGLTVTIISIFFIAYFSPAHFSEITLALGAVPNGYWALLATIIGFYFGGRMQLKSQQFKFDESQAQAVKALIETKKAFRKLEMDTDEPDRAIGDQAAKNSALDSTRQGQKNVIVEHYLDVKDKDDKDKKEELSEQVNRIKTESPNQTRSRHTHGKSKLQAFAHSSAN